MVICKVATQTNSNYDLFYTVYNLFGFFLIHKINFMWVVIGVVIFSPSYRWRCSVKNTIVVTIEEEAKPTHTRNYGRRLERNLSNIGQGECVNDL